MSILKNLQVLLGKSDTTQTPSNTSTQTVTQKKVLIVEDEKVLADALEIKFQHENFAVLKAENGQIGLEMIQANKPDAVLLDLMMPVMDGKTMLHKLRAIPEFKYLPVVVLTNAGDVENIKQTKQYDNASAFLIKSNINPEDAINIVKELLRM
jgi:two-component system chemotaxis response regulator CheY